MCITVQLDAVHAGSASWRWNLVISAEEEDQIVRFGTVEGLYRCDRSCLRQYSEYIGCCREFRM